MLVHARAGSPERVVRPRGLASERIDLREQLIEAVVRRDGRTRGFALRSPHQSMGSTMMFVKALASMTSATRSVTATMFGL